MLGVPETATWELLATLADILSVMSPQSDVPADALDCMLDTIGYQQERYKQPADNVAEAMWQVHTDALLETAHCLRLLLPPTACRLYYHPSRIPGVIHLEADLYQWRLPDFDTEAYA
jgi:hypothetical protein